MGMRRNVLRNRLMTIQTDVISMPQALELLVRIGVMHRVARDAGQLTLLKAGGCNQTEILATANTPGAIFPMASVKRMSRILPRLEVNRFLRRVQISASSISRAIGIVGFIAGKVRVALSADLRGDFLWHVCGMDDRVCPLLCHISRVFPPSHMRFAWTMASLAGNSEFYNFRLKLSVLEVIVRSAVQ